MTPQTDCISLVAYLKAEVFGGDGRATIDAWKELSDQDKRDLHAYATAEGAKLNPLS